MQGEAAPLLGDAAAGRPLLRRNAPRIL